MVGLGADDVLAAGIENNQVSVAAHRNRALTRIQTEQLGGSSGDQFDKAIHAEAPGPDSAGINQTHAVLDSRPAVGDFGEIASSEFLLFPEAKWTMVSRYHLQVIALQALPKFFLMPFLTQRRRKNVFGAFKIGHIEILERKVQILRTGLGINGKATIPCLAHLLESIVTAEVNDIHWRPGHLGQRNCPSSCFCLGRGWPR